MQRGLEQAASEVQVPAVVARILAGRGIAPEAMGVFLQPDYERDMHDPFDLMDMQVAVERILLAAERGEKVAVYGDYDIDGITASAVMLTALAAQGVAAQSYIPDRFDEGYGINQPALERLQAEGVSLVVSVDCGITSVTEAAWACEHGLDLIITDHHAVPDVIPKAVAVINPKRSGQTYPFAELAGVGVAFMVVMALQARTGKPAAGQEKWLLDLVALGTVCDVVPLVDENRMLVSCGLRVLRRTRRVGLRELSAVGGVEVPELSARSLGFVLGPRMNAAGRLEHASGSLELVRTDDAVRARELAQQLDGLNRRRRAEQDAIFEAADALAAARVDDPVLVLADPDWSHGVVGIVASKLAEKWHKPVLVAQIMGESTKGSARSVAGFNMVDGLRANAELLTKFGGHFFAAGYTLPTSKLEELRAGMAEYYRRSEAAGGDSEPQRRVDIILADLADVNWDLLEQLALMEPYGNGNPEPVLQITGLVVADVARIGKDGRHLRMKLEDGQKRRLAAIGFGLASSHEGLRMGQRLTATGLLNKNEYLGTRTLQLVLAALDYE